MAAADAHDVGGNRPQESRTTGIILAGKGDAAASAYANTIETHALVGSRAASEVALCRWELLQPLHPLHLAPLLSLADLRRGGDQGRQDIVHVVGDQV